MVFFKANESKQIHGVLHLEPGIYSVAISHQEAQHCKIELSCCAFCFIYDIIHLLLIATYVKIIMIIVEYNMVRRR